MTTRNLKKKLKEEMSNDIYDILLACSKIANQYDYKIYLIGGVVRDLLLNRTIFDVDITVEGDAINFCHKLSENKLCKIIQVQNDLKTAKVNFNNKIEVDFASTRQEFYPRRGHLPVVARLGCTLEEDVYRRDFTVNSLAISLNQENFGDIIDYVNGLNDIDKKLLRILHDNSFNEDPSRIIRGVKFATRFNFNREEKTKNLQEEYQNHNLHKDISWSRIKSELRQTFSLNNPKAFDIFINNEVYKLVYGEKTNIKGLEIKTLIDKYPVQHVWLVYLGCSLRNKEIIENLCFTREEQKIFSDIEKLLNHNLSLLNSNYQIYKFFSKCATEAILVYYLQTKRKEALIYLEKLSHVKVCINGNDLLNIGVKEGKEVGVLLEQILRKKLDGNLVSKDDEIKFIKNKIK